MNTILVWYGNSVRTNNLKKTRTQNTQWEQRYGMKNVYRSITRRNVRHFPPTSGQIAFVCDVLGNMGMATSIDARGDSSYHKRTGVKKMINGKLVSSEMISLWFASVYVVASSKSTRTVNSARCTSTQRHIWLPICPSGQFQYGNIRKITKNSNFKRHFLERGWS